MTDFEDREAYDIENRRQERQRHEGLRGGSWAPEALPAGDDHWTPNGVRFSCLRCCDAWAFDLLLRWTGCRDTRSAWSPDEPNRDCVCPEPAETTTE